MYEPLFVSRSICSLQGMASSSRRRFISIGCVMAIHKLPKASLVELVVVGADVGLVQHAIVVTDHLHASCTLAECRVS
jgi:hypothetical protein